MPKSHFLGGDDEQSVAGYNLDVACGGRHPQFPLEAIRFKLQSLGEEVQALIRAISDGSFFKEG